MSAEKRSHDDVQHIPDGFKIYQDRVVYGKYHKMELNKVPVTRMWFDSMEDDAEEKKVKVYVEVKHLSDEDQTIISEVDTALADAAKVLDRKHSPLVNGDGLLKLCVINKFAKRRKTAIIKHDHTISGTFMFSSVYDYMQWYGTNLIVPKKDKKPNITQVPKPKEEKKEEVSEDSPDKEEDKE